jgi:hypothetical protein
MLHKLSQALLWILLLVSLYRLVMLILIELAEQLVKLRLHQIGKQLRRLRSPPNQTTSPYCKKLSQIRDRSI